MDTNSNRDPAGVFSTSMRAGNLSRNSSMWVMTRMQANSGWTALIA